MRIADNVEILEINVQKMGTYYPVLLWDDQNVVLIDTGYPGNFELLQTALEGCGLSAEQVTKVILTHEDIDHIGNARLFKEKGAEIMASQAETPRIQGEQPLTKIADMEAHLDELPPERRSFYDFLKMSAPELSVPVDTQLTDGQVIDACGGIKVVSTPGHTPGHIALLLQESGLIVCGDAANISDGQLVGANPPMTHNADDAAKSLARIKALDVSGYACYHTGYLAKTPRKE